MDLDRDIRGLLAMVIHEETQFMKHYLGLVADNKDELGRGRVLVTIPELGFDTAAQGLWCWPRQADSLSVPEPDSYVEVYFMGGHPDRPVYLSYTSEMLGSELSLHNKVPESRVIFESPKTKEGIHYDDKTKKLVIKGGDEPLVLGNKIVTSLNTLITELKAHVHPYVDTPVGASNTSAPAPGSISDLAGDELSEEIFVK